MRGEGDEAMSISRRGFIGAAAGLAGLGLLPSWRTFKQRRQIDLMPFCADDNWRYTLDAPFAQDGMVYGTDGRVCVRTTLADVPELADGVRLPPASALPWWAHEAKWRPYPKRRLITWQYSATCPECDGKGGLAGLTKCQVCDGEGEAMLASIDEAEFWSKDFVTIPPCTACRGTGWTATVLCDYCEGKGETRRPSIQPIGDMIFAGHYDRKIRALGDVEYALVAAQNTLGYSVLAFRGDGFEGLLMPLNKD
jgi:hypothetical protein